jgi:hypothetical protein
LTLSPDSNQRILTGIQTEDVDVARPQHLYGQVQNEGSANALILISKHFI